MEKTQITVDTETLGRGETAQIVQIAAIAFDNDGNQLGEFNKYIDWINDTHGFTMDERTIAFWLRQPKEVQDSVFGEKTRHPIARVLREFEEWCNQWKSYNIWQHSTFDAPKLQYAIRKVFKTEPQIPYNAWKDIRTLTEITGIEKTETKGIPHNAYDDCVNQKNYIVQCLNKYG